MYFISVNFFMFSCTHNDQHHRARAGDVDFRFRPDRVLRCMQFVVWRRESFAKHPWVKLKRLSILYFEFLDLWMCRIQKDVFLQRINRRRDY